MPTFGQAVARFKRLTPPLTPFPMYCAGCAGFLHDDQQISIVESRIFPHVLHTKCKRLFLPTLQSINEREGEKHR